jgi:hypothetical protein
MVHKNDTVFFPPLHGTGGAGGYAPGILAMEAGHENVRCPGSSIDKLGADFNDLTEFRLRWERFVAFTLDFAGMASNTFLLVLQHEIFTHYFPP